MDADDYRLPTVLIIPLIQIMVVGFLFIALLVDHRELTVLILVILTILAGTKIWSYFSPAGIEHETILDKRRVFPDEKLTVTTGLRNAKILPVLAEISVSFTKSFRSPDNLEKLKKGCSLLWYQKTSFKWTLIALRRGVYRLGPVDLTVGDLFGFYSRKPMDPAAPIDVIVYPRLIALKPFHLPKLDLFGTPGVKSPIEDPVYVYGTRAYQSGRPARYIHWKASARLARLQEKICEPAAQEKILLIVEVGHFSKHQAHAEFEKVLEVAASAAVHFDRAGFAVGLVTNGELKGGGSTVLPISRGTQQTPKILETFARLQLTPAIDLAKILRRGIKLPWGTTGVSFSYDYAESCKEILAFFNYRRGPIVSVVCRKNPTPLLNQGLQPGSVLSLAEICED